MSEQDIEQYREFVGKLQLEEQRCIALENIKNFLLIKPAATAANTLNDVGISSIFNCLKLKDKVQFEMTCEILALCFEKFNPGEAIKKYTPHIMFMLRHEQNCLRKLAVQEVYKSTVADPALLPVPEYTPVFVAVGQLVSDSDVGIANKAILITSHLPKQAYPKVLEEMKVAVECDNRSSKCNAFEVVINVSTYSSDLLLLCAQHGYIDCMLAELNTNDVLYQLNILELLSRLAVTPHGIRHLVENGALNRISDSVAAIKTNPLRSLLIPGYMKFFGSIAHLYPKEVLEKYPVLVACVCDAFESRDQSALPVALDTLGFIGTTIEGKLCLAALGGRYQDLVNNVCELIRNGVTELKVRAVICLANLISVEKDRNLKTPVDPRITLMTREWFRGLNGGTNTADVLLTMCKNPFNDIKIAGFNLLDAICQHRWGEEMIAKTAGFVEYLLDRTFDHTKETKEAKYDIIRRLARSSAFDASTSVRFNTYIEEGPFFIQSGLEVAIEEGD